jgi:hypothetical protein
MFFIPTNLGAIAHNGLGIAEGGEINGQMLSLAPQLAKSSFIC